MTNLLHVHLPSASDEYGDLWLNASKKAGTTVVETPGKRRSARDLVVLFEHLIKKFRPRVLVTHWDDAIRPAAWAAYRSKTRLLCHRYEAVPLPLDRAHRAAYGLVRAFVLPGEAYGEQISLLGLPVETFPVCGGGRVVGGAPSGTVGMWDPHPLMLKSLKRHLDRHYPGTRLVGGPAGVPGTAALDTVEDLLEQAKVIVERRRLPRVGRYLLDAVACGRVVVAPGSAVMREALGDHAMYYDQQDFFAVLREALAAEMAPTKMAVPRDTVEVLRDIYKRAAS